MNDLTDFQSNIESAHYLTAMGTMETQLKELDIFENRMIAEIAERNRRLQAAKNVVDKLTKARNSLKEYLDSMTDSGEVSESDD